MLEPSAGHASPPSEPVTPPVSSSPAGLDAAIAVAAVLVIAVSVRRGWHRLDRGPSRPRPFSAMGGAALFLAMLVAGSIGVQLAAMLLAGPEASETASPLARPAALGLGAYLGQLAVVGVYVLLRRRGDRPIPDRRRSRGRAVLIGLMALAAWWPIVQAVSACTALLAEAISGAPTNPVAHETLRLLQAAPRDAWFVITLISVVVAAPLVEEVLYRGIVQQTVRTLGYPPWWSIVITSGLFALMHITVADAYAVAPLFVLSLGFGWAYERTGRLTTPLVMHGAFNAFNLLLALGP